MSLHADQHGASRIVGQNLRFALEAGALTNAQVVSATSASGLKTNISAASVHADQKPMLHRINRAIDIGIADGTLSDANVQAATGVNNLATARTQSGAGNKSLWE